MDSSSSESDPAGRPNNQRIGANSHAVVSLSTDWGLSDDPKASNSSVGGYASPMSSLSDEEDNNKIAPRNPRRGDKKRPILAAEGEDNDCSLQPAHQKRCRGPSKKDKQAEGPSESRNDDSMEYSLDLTTVRGQLVQNPHLTPEQAKKEAKREYNRCNAARARVRNKKLMKELQERCATLTSRQEVLERENEILRAQLRILRGQGVAPGEARGAHQMQQATTSTMNAQPPPRPLVQQPQVQPALLQQQQPSLAGIPSDILDMSLQHLVNVARNWFLQAQTPPTPIATLHQRDLLSHLLQRQSQQQALRTIPSALSPQQPTECDPQQQQALLAALLQGNDAALHLQEVLRRQ